MQIETETPSFKEQKNEVDKYAEVTKQNKPIHIIESKASSPKAKVTDTNQNVKAKEQLHVNEEVKGKFNSMERRTKSSKK